MFFPKHERPSLTPIQNNTENYSLANFNPEAFKGEDGKKQFSELNGDKHSTHLMCS